MRRAAIGILLVAVSVLQVSVLSALPFPGAVPDILLVAVIVVGMTSGPAPGALVGLVGGLLVDTVPPATSPFGLWMVLLCGAGVAAGRIGPRATTRVALLAGIVVLTTSVVLLRCLVAALGPGLSPGTALLTVAVSALYAALLAPVIVPAVERLARWSRPLEAA